jgi:hypothetical protein
VDARTTPRALQPLVLGLLAVLGLYLAAAFPFARAQLGTVELPSWAEPIKPYTWLARWRMFTELRPSHLGVEVVAVTDAAKVEVDLAALYPCRWNEGPGYARDDFLRDADAVAALSADICARVDAGSLRWTRLRWPKTLGAREQPVHDVERRPLWEVPCDGGRPRPLERRR